MNIIDVTVQFFVGGGPMMIPIGLTGLIGAAIGVERYIKLRQVERANRKIWDQLQPVLDQGDFDKARALTVNDQSTVSNLLRTSLELQGSVRRREVVEVVMEEEMMTIVPTLETRTSYIALYANLATLTGLLGTVLGLIAAFDAVANAAPAEKANLLSNSIAAAMNCTAFGLICAIPLLIFSLFIVTKTTRIVESLDIISIKTLNIISASTRVATKAE